MTPLVVVAGGGGAKDLVVGALSLLRATRMVSRGGLGGFTPSRSLVCVCAALWCTLVRACAQQRLESLKRCALHLADLRIHTLTLAGRVVALQPLQ